MNCSFEAINKHVGNVDAYEAFLLVGAYVNAANFEFVHRENIFYFLINAEYGAAQYVQVLWM